MLSKLFKLSVCLFLTLAGLSSISAFAQNRTITGTVLDQKGQPVISAAVMVVGTKNGAVTDLDGRFSMEVPSGDVKLDVSCLGYVSSIYIVSGKTNTAVITISEDQMTLNETVVVGYGTQKKVNLTGAITAVQGEELQNRVSHSVTTMLQGSVPGLNISTSSGNPGNTASINIRGVTSINGASPIVLIDGAIGDLNRVNPNDVASISIIKDAAAAAVYGARAAFGVILVTTKSGSNSEGKATVRYSGRFGWEEPTTSTDYETRGYWSVYTHNLFKQADNEVYITYNDYDMQQLLARVNDKTENPDRPWVVEQERNGKKQWAYYANTDYWHELFNDQHPTVEHSVSISGGSKGVKYLLSGSYDRQVGIIKAKPDVFGKYNLRAKLDFDINKYVKMSNNTSFYSSSYSYQGVDNVENAIAYSSRHFLSCFTTKNPDGTWLYATPYINYKVGNGRHIALGNKENVNKDRKSDFANTTEIVIKPVRTFWLTANYTYRLFQNRNTNRRTNFVYRVNPGEALGVYSTGAGQDALSESVGTYNYVSSNIFATYEETYKNVHHVTAVGGFNLETQNYKGVGAIGQNLLSKDLNDLDLVGPNADGEVITQVSGGQSEYALMGFFARLNYDYKGKYLAEVSGRYDGTSRFASGSRWGFFPSVSGGWRVSEEPFFAPAKKIVNNLKVRASFGSLGNQNVSNYAYLRKVSSSDLNYTFGEGSSLPKSSSLSSPNASDLTWETSQQYNLGLDASLFDSRLEFTGEVYIRDTKDMLTSGVALPSIYGASSPKMNAADLRTSGYELSLGWRDQVKVSGKPFNYYVKGSLSDYRSEITKFDNPDKSFAKGYYEGMRIGDIWGFTVDGLFDSDEEAKAYTSNIDCSYIKTRMNGGFLAGDLKYVDTDGDNKISIGANTADYPGDRKVLGNSLASLQYGFSLGFDWMGFDVSTIFQGTGNHYWYPPYESMIFWGPYANPYCSYLAKDFLDDVWAVDNKDAYFPRPRQYAAHSGQAELGAVNSRYIQNIRYLRFKNLTVGYTIPEYITKKIHIDNVRVYFSGENLAYWSPFKKHSKYIDPEAAFTRDDDGKSAYNNAFYPWQKTFMFGIDVTF